MAGTHTMKRLFWMDLQTAEDVFGEENTTPTYSNIPVDASTFVQPASTIFTDEDKLEGGRIEKTSQGIYDRKGPWTSTVSVVRVTPHVIAGIMSYAMGTVATDDDVSSLTGTNQHAIQPIDQLELKSFSMIEQRIPGTTGVRNRFTGCGIPSFSLTYSRGSNRMVDFSFDILAALKESGTPTAIALGTVVGAGEERPLNAAYGGIWLGPRTAAATSGIKTLATSDPHISLPGDVDAGATAGFATSYGDLDVNVTTAAGNDITKRLRTVTYNWSNEMDPEELMRFGDGESIGIIERNDIAQTVDLTFDYVNEDEVTAFLNPEGTNLVGELRIRTSRDDLTAPVSTTKAGREGLVLSYDSLKYASISHGEGNRRQTITATMNVFSPEGNARSVLAKVYNAFDAGYAT